MKVKIAVMLLVAGSYMMALGLNCLPNIGGTLDLSGLLGGN
jgi:hypothetical protein